MAAHLPQYVIDHLDRSLDVTPESIIDQCGARADPLFQDWRYNIICDTLREFRERNITCQQLQHWRTRINAIYPWDGAYDTYRQIVNRRFTAFPALIAMTTSATQVKAALLIARKYALPFCVRGGAHAYENYSLINAGIIIDQSRRTKISLCQNQVTIEPGVLNGPLADFLSHHGLAIAQGTCANVGVAGLCLGGGMGFLGRRFGLTSDNLLRATLVLANGNSVTVDATHHPDLFWAIRGAGNGNFGIVTSLTLQAHPVKEVLIYELRWRFRPIYDVLSTYLSWVQEEHQVGAEMDIFSLRTVNPLMITGIGFGSEAELRHILGPLLALKPAVVKIWSATYVEAARHFTYARFPPPYFKNKSYFVYQQLPRSVVPIIARYMSNAGPNDRIEINGLGGAYRQGGGSFAHRGAIGWLQYITRWGTVPDELSPVGTPGWNNEIGPQRIAWVQGLYQEMLEAAPQALRGAYVGCFDADLKDFLQQYYGASLPRLLEVKQQYDPQGLLAYPQGLSH